MLTVTGEVTPFQGKTKLELGFGKQKLKHTSLVADIENDGILGMDFLKAHQCGLELTRQIMKLNREKILCFANSRNVQPRCCRVAVLLLNVLFCVSHFRSYYSLFLSYNRS